MLPVFKVPPHFAPLIDLAQDMLLSPADVAKRYGYKDDHLSNLRKAGKGWPFIRLPTGRIKYRASDILAGELAGYSPFPLSLELVKLAIVSTPGLSPQAAAAAIAHLEEALKAGQLTEPAG